MAETNNNTNTPKKKKGETTPLSCASASSGAAVSGESQQRIVAETNTPPKKRDKATKSNTPATSNDPTAAAQKAAAAALTKATEILRNGGLSQAEASAAAKEVVRCVLQEEQAKYYGRGSNNGGDNGMNAGTKNRVDDSLGGGDRGESSKKKKAETSPPRASASDLGRPHKAATMAETSNNTNTPKTQKKTTQVKRKKALNWMKKYPRVKASSYRNWKTLIKLNETQPHHIDILDFTDFVDVHGAAAFDTIFPKIHPLGNLYPPPEYLETGAKVREWRHFTNPKQKQEIELIGQRKEKEIITEERSKGRAERVKNRSTLLSVAESISQMKTADEGRISQPSAAVAEASIGLASLAAQEQPRLCPGVTLANIRQSTVKEDRKTLIQHGFQYVVRESWQTRYQLTDPKYPGWKRRRAITPNAMITGAIMDPNSTEFYWYVEEVVAGEEDGIEEELSNTALFFEQFVIRDVGCAKSYTPNHAKSRNKQKLLGCEACVKSCQALFRRCTESAELQRSSATTNSNRFMNNGDLGRDNPRLMKHMIDLQTQELDRMRQLNHNMLAEWKNNQVSSEDDNVVGGLVSTTNNEGGGKRGKKRPLSSVEEMDEQEFETLVKSATYKFQHGSTASS